MIKRKLRFFGYCFLIKKKKNKGGYMTLIVFNGILVTVNIEKLIKVKVKVVPIHLKINLNYTLMKLTFTNLN